MREDAKKSFMVSKPIIRDIAPTDIPALASIKYGDVIHRDRMHETDGRNLRYLVVAVRGEVVGFGLLVLGQPTNWPRMKHVPQMIDLQIRGGLRGYGFGTLLISEMENMARDAGHREMFLGVDPENNSRAMRLYERLGYEPIDSKPVEDHWEYVDSAGVRHAGVEWIIHMRKALV